MAKVLPSEPTVKPSIKLAGLFLGPLLMLAVLTLPPPQGMPEAAWKVVALAVLMVVWWTTEAIPLPATSLLPLVFFPTLGVLKTSEAAIPYANPAIFLFMGGFIIALAMEKWRLHTRIALHIVRLTGTSPSRMLLGFMTATATISLWISNTATAVMMLPLVLSVIKLFEEQMRQDPVSARNFAISMLLGLAYAASIGGLGTLVGTPTNMIFKGFMAANYQINIGFVQWMLFGVPLVLVLILFMWALFSKWLFPVCGSSIEGSEHLIGAELAKLGRMSQGEKATAAVFTCTAFLWVFQEAINPLIPFDLNDTTIAIAGALALFLWPLRLAKAEFVMSWADTAKLPWGVLILFGGGLSLASGFEKTGLAEWIGSHMEALKDFPPLITLAITLVVIVVMSEFMSNVATITMFLPVLVAVAVGLGQNPLLFAIPAAAAASMGFMLPVATAANALVYGAGVIRPRDMIKAGIWLDIVSILVILLATYLIALPVFDIAPGVVPEWAGK